MEKNPGGQKFWQRGGGEISWNSILPPQKCVLPLKCPPKFRDLAPPLIAEKFNSHVENESKILLWSTHDIRHEIHHNIRNKVQTG